MRRRYRVTGRFYLFVLLIVAVIVYFVVRPYLPQRVRTATVGITEATVSQKMSCVLVRDESVTEAANVSRVEFVAPENSLVEKGETVAYLYAAGYSSSLLSDLETTREKIQEYHKELLANIVDNALSRLDSVVDVTAESFKSLITRKTVGSLRAVTEQLETAMVNRQEYMRKNKREDTKLTKLYDEENTRLNKIQSWRKASNAAEEGVVSFYLDGYENALSADDIESLEISDARTVLNGGALEGTEALKTTGVYRLVDQENWYVAVVVEGDGWVPTADQTYQMQMEGYDDLTYTAVVTAVQKSGNTTMAVFHIQQPMGPLIYVRSGKARFSTTLTGLTVPEKALRERDGQIGVLLYDTENGTFIPVEVLSREGGTALVQPLTDGALTAGASVIIQ